MIGKFINTYQEDMIRFFLVLILGIVVIKVVLKLLDRSSLNKKIEPTIGKFFIGLTKFILYAAFLIILLSMLGVPMTTFVAMLSAVGLAIALALQGNLANFSSTLVILFFKPFKVGDFIESGSHMGTVQEIQILFTHILTPDNRKVIIPNADLVNLRVTNYTAEKTRRVDLLFSASYEDDVNQVIEVIQSVVQSNSHILSEPEAVVRLIKHGDSALEYDVKVWIEKENYWNVKYGINEGVRSAFLEHGIKIPYPQRELWMTKSSEVTSDKAMLEAYSKSEAE